MKLLVAMVGLPRSGKSTWARQTGYPIVCPDEIRKALHGRRYEVLAEPFVWAIAKVMVRALFGAGHPVVVVDATNTTLKRREEWYAEEWETRFKVIPTLPSECHRRAIEEGDQEIRPIIDKMAVQFEPLGAGELLFEGEAP